MKRLILFLLIFIFILGNYSHAKNPADSTYYKRLYYTCKVWGFLKYFHTEVAKGTINWDNVLTQTLGSVKNNISNEDYNNTLQNLINSAGKMTQPSAELPNVPDDLKFNLNFSWLNDPVFSINIKARLDTIKNWFRPQDNYYVGAVSGIGNPTFIQDSAGYQWGINQYPGEEIRLLALFRYWNIINYFYPNKYLIDNNWDSILTEFIPKFIHAPDGLSFHFSFSELITKINDSHAFASSKLINDYFGFYFLPLTLKYVENETVVTGVFADNTGIKNGDIIKAIDNVDIKTIREKMRSFIGGSNDAAINRDINYYILLGDDDAIVQLTIENENGQKMVDIARIFSPNYFKLIVNTGPVWKILDAVNSRKLGYVDMGRLNVSEIKSMFNDLWNTDGIIFDIRNYPNGTLWSLINYLYADKIHNADFTAPDVKYPGTVYWFKSIIGFGDFSKIYNKDIFLLFDESTQSQAEYTVMSLEQHPPKAIKIGSQTAGADGDVSPIYLPGGIMTYFTGLGVFYPDHRQTQRIGIVPDVVVNPTIAGIRSGRDEVLEAALNYNTTGVKNNLAGYLYQNYPNPFNPSTVIKYSISKSGNVRLEIYNILGEKIKTLINEFQKAGDYQYNYLPDNLPSGVYIYKISSGNFIQSKKMLLLK